VRFPTGFRTTLANSQSTKSESITGKFTKSILNQLKNPFKLLSVGWNCKIARFHAELAVDPPIAAFPLFSDSGLLPDALS